MILPCPPSVPAYLQCSKVDDIVNVRMLVEDSIQLLLVGDIAGVVLRSLARDELNAVDDLLGRVVRVVDNDHLVVGLKQREGGE